MIVFYDRTGEAVAYSDDEVHIFMFDGAAIAYMDADAVFSYRGILLGWFEMGWLRDKDGHCIAFSDNPIGGPQRPMRQALPVPVPKQSVPVKERQDPRTLRPIHSNAWAEQSAWQFFAHAPYHWPGYLRTGATARGNQ